MGKMKEQLHEDWHLEVHLGNRWTCAEGIGEEKCCDAIH